MLVIIFYIMDFGKAMTTPQALGITILTAESRTLRLLDPHRLIAQLSATPCVYVAEGQLAAAFKLFKAAGPEGFQIVIE
jgi:hypothetical protein